MKHELCGQHWVDGRWAAAGADTLDAVNPATGEILLPPFAEATFDEVNAAVSAAHRAQLVARDRDARWPAELLHGIASQIEGLGDELLERGEAETGLPRARLTGERARTCAQIRMFAEIVREGSWV